MNKLGGCQNPVLILLGYTGFVNPALHMYTSLIYIYIGDVAVHLSKDHSCVPARVQPGTPTQVDLKIQWQCRKKLLTILSVIDTG